MSSPKGKQRFLGFFEGEPGWQCSGISKDRVHAEIERFQTGFSFLCLNKEESLVEGGEKFTT